MDECVEDRAGCSCYYCRWVCIDNERMCTEYCIINNSYLALTEKINPSKYYWNILLMIVELYEARTKIKTPNEFFYEK